MAHVRTRSASLLVLLGLVALVLTPPVEAAVPFRTSTSNLGPIHTFIVPPAPKGMPGTWRLVFTDDFAGSTLDSSRWSTGWFGPGVTGPVNDREPVCYDSRQVQLSGTGVLALDLVAHPQYCAGRTRPWSSGLVSSNGKFSYTYGASEARIHLQADGSGRPADWPAFWTDGQHWPDDGENDVIESLDGVVGPHFHSSAGSSGLVVPGAWTGWHTFGSLWEAGKVTYYYDGRAVGTIGTGVTGSPMYLVLNLAPSYSGATVPARMQVDYVRVWQR